MSTRGEAEECWVCPWGWRRRSATPLLKASPTVSFIRTTLTWPLFLEISFSHFPPFFHWDSQVNGLQRAYRSNYEADQTILPASQHFTITSRGLSWCQGVTLLVVWKSKDHTVSKMWNCWHNTRWRLEGIHIHEWRIPLNKSSQSSNKTQ